MEPYERVNKLLGTEFKSLNHIPWFILSTKFRMSELFIREFKDYVDWDSISMYQELSENFIREFKDEVNWSIISDYQSLSEEFIDEFSNLFDWELLSECQDLSENFIRKFSNKVSWSHISKYQRLSKVFIKEFNLDTLSINDNLNYKSKSEVRRMISNCHSETYDDYFIGYSYCLTKLNNLDIYDIESYYKCYDSGMRRCKIYYKDLIDLDYARKVYPEIDINKLNGNESLFCNSLVRINKIKDKYRL